MSESQSRYSIVERLTRTKLRLMGDKLDLDEDIKKLEQKIENRERELENTKVIAEEDLKRDLESKEREIEVLKSTLDFKKGRKQEKQEVFEAKMKEIDGALDAITEISRTAGTENK